MIVSALRDLRNSVCTLRTIEKALSQSALLWTSHDTLLGDEARLSRVASSDSVKTVRLVVGSGGQLLVLHELKIFVLILQHLSETGN